MARIYNDPAGGQQSSIGDTQFEEFYYQKKALIEARKEAYFMQMADTIGMPKHYGKTIKRYHYLPLLEDSNLNDQGLDAAGRPDLDSANTNYVAVIKVTGPGIIAADGSDNAYYFRGESGEGGTTQQALDAAKAAVNDWVSRPTTAGGLGAVLTTPVDDPTDYGVHSTTGGSYSAGSNPFDAGYRFSQDQLADVVTYGFNLYGSSKDVGTIQGKFPALTENGGRVNRVGFRRIELQGSIEKFGFFDEYTKESVDFDSDADLMMHINREMVNAAHEMTEDQLQVDLLNSAGVVRYAGGATTDSELGGAGGDEADVVTLMDLIRLNVDLDDNRCPKNTKLITGSRMIDTKTVNAARYMYIGSELIPTLKKMPDIAGTAGAGWTSVEKYGSATTIANGEIGAVDQFRMILVPEMMHWAGAGATVVDDALGLRETGGNFDVFPMLVVGSESFTTIGFQTDGKSVKFKIKHVKPESDISYSAQDPYGEKGFMSIKWYYGFMLLRPERIALIKTLAYY